MEERYDSLSLYHHRTFSIEPKLQALLEVLDQPKNTGLNERFEQLRKILDEEFCIELAHRLHLIDILPSSAKHALLKDAYHHPMQLLHFLFALFCTDSVEFIAEHTNLSYAETAELFRELSKSYTIESLISRILDLYYENQYNRERHHLSEEAAHLGLELTKVPEDTNEERRRRMLRKYGDLTNIKKQLLLTD